jgi:hypothetical protein
MLNAVKHLYRTVGTSSSDAVEMLHCVQHDPFLCFNLTLCYRTSSTQPL